MTSTLTSLSSDSNSQQRFLWLLPVPLLAAALVALLFLPVLAQETPAAYLVTNERASAYQGPGEFYPLLAIYTQGITLTVTGRTPDSTWLQVALTPFNTAWMPAAAFGGPPALQDLPLAATPAGLVTVTPDAGPPLTVSLQVVSGKFEGNQSGPRFSLRVHTREPRTRVNIRLINPAGQQVWKSGGATDAEGNYSEIFRSWTYTDGVYTVIVTDAQGNEARASVKFDAFHEPTPTPKK